jgi:hypothetical protein
MKRSKGNGAKADTKFTMMHISQHAQRTLRLIDANNDDDI